MIKITEQKPKKIPGLSSLSVEFDYNPMLVNIIKSKCNGSVFDKKTSKWECNIGYLTTLLDSLSEFDDIELSLLEEDKTEIVNHKVVSPKSTVKLYKHQIEAVNYGLQDNHKKWLLLDGMGMGKSLTSITLSYNLQKTKKVKKVLIVCGVNAVKTNWKKEIEQFSDMSVRVLGEKTTKKGDIVYGGVSDRLKQLKEKIPEFFVITNIETLRDKEIIKELTNPKSKNKFDMIIVDEIHRIKNPSAEQSKGLLKLSAEYQIGLSGTPIINSPEDSYMPLKWLDIDKANFSTFKGNFITYGGPFGNIPTGFKNLDVLKNEIDTNSLRRLKESTLDLPSKTVINKIIDMNPTQTTFYENIKKGIIDEVDKVQLTTQSLIGMIVRFRQATECPSFLTTENIPCSKIDVTAEMVSDIVDSNEKVVIFTTYKETVKQLAETLSKYRPIVCTGDTKDSDFSRNIELFQNNPDYKVFIGTWSKCGTGITLTSASYMIFLSTPYTQAEFSQSQDRIYRIGTSKPVTIYNLICNGTIDERVAEIVGQKEALSDYIVDDKAETEKSIEYLKKYIEDLTL